MYMLCLTLGYKREELIALCGMWCWCCSSVNAFTRVGVARYSEGVTSRLCHSP